MFAIVSLLVVVAVSLIITRVAAVILTVTGLPRQVARFQARSAFTGAGFTTSESEAMVHRPLRRRVAMTLMLLGNIGIVASASSLILGFRDSGAGPTWARVLALGVGLLLLLLVSRSTWFERNLGRLIRTVLDRFADLSARDLAGLLSLPDTYGVSELAVRDGDWLAGHTLAELELRREGIDVLGITRAGGYYRGSPAGSTVLYGGDTMVVHGYAAAVRELDRRPAGPEGTQLHNAAVERHRQHLRTEHAGDPSPTRGSG